MKITIELPDSAVALVMSYIYKDKNGENLLEGEVIEGDALKNGYYKTKGVDENDT